MRKNKQNQRIICDMDNKLADKPFTMFGIASLFFFAIFKPFIPADLAKDYLAGAILHNGCSYSNPCGSNSRLYKLLTL